MGQRTKSGRRGGAWGGAKSAARAKLSNTGHGGPTQAAACQGHSQFGQDRAGAWHDEAGLLVLHVFLAFVVSALDYVYKATPPPPPYYCNALPTIHTLVS